MGKERENSGGGEERSYAGALRHGNSSVSGHHLGSRAVVAWAVESGMRCNRVSNLCARLEDDDGLAAICCVMSSLFSPLRDHDPCADFSNGVFSCGNLISSRL